MSKRQDFIPLDAKDIALVKDRFMNPASMLFAPLTPAMVISDMPTTYFFILLSASDFYSLSTRLCRTYIYRFEKIYLSIFFALLTLRIGLEFLDDAFKVVLLVVGPLIWVFWALYSFRCWRLVYCSAHSA